jgi:hypothetical protein
MASDHVFGDGHYTYSAVKTEFQLQPWERFSTRGVVQATTVDNDQPTLEVIRPDEWTGKGKCVAPTDGSGNVAGDYRWAWDLDGAQAEKAAARLCAGCPVIEECLAAAMEEERGSADNRQGIRGGLGPISRALLQSEARTCRAGHSRTEFGCRKVNGYWACLLCEANRQRQRGWCSICGHPLALGSISRHRRRNARRCWNSELLDAPPVSVVAQ